MANQRQLAILKKGVETWNQWRERHFDIEPDLSGANLSGANLSRANLSRANLSRAILDGANLSGADLTRANLRIAHLIRAHLRKADLSEARLYGVDLYRAHLRGANLKEVYLNGADLREADLSKVNLFRAYLRDVLFDNANLCEADLRMATFSWDSYPIEAMSPGIATTMRGANLSRATLSGADLSMTDFTKANLSGADLSWANLSRSDLSGADLTGCLIYGTAAWDVILEGTRQPNLVITDPERSNAPIITVDNLEVAQFINLLLNNQKIREVIDTVTSKVILILGRFTPERKIILDTLRKELGGQNYTPVIFDFEKPTTQDFTETISTLAHLSRFIIADLTDPNSIPQELYAIVPHRMVPVQPLLKESDDSSHPSREYSMFIDLRKRYHWILSTHRYREPEDLLASLQTKVIEPAEQKAKELAKLRAQEFEEQ
jgi:uncharacterized protein YjbI with pentapeptide repeats